MKIHEFNKLTIGDKAIIKNGLNRGRVVEIYAVIKDDDVGVIKMFKPLDGGQLKSIDGYLPFLGARDLGIYKGDES